MSAVKSRKAYIFHTELGAVITEIRVVEKYGVEDIIKDRAISQARAIQFLNQANRVSVNDTKAARTMDSVYTKVDVRLPE